MTDHEQIMVIGYALIILAIITLVVLARKAVKGIIMMITIYKDVRQFKREGLRGLDAAARRRAKGDVS